MPIEEAKKHQESPVRAPNTVPLSIASNGNGFSVVPYAVTVAPVLFSMQSGNPVEKSFKAENDVASQTLARPMQCSSTMEDLKMRNQMAQEPLPLSLRLSLSSCQDQPSTQASAFQMMQGFKNEDCTISVA